MYRDKEHMKGSESLIRAEDAALTDELETEYGSMVCKKTLRYQSIMVDEKTRERLDRLTFLMILSSVLS